MKIHHRELNEVDFIKMKTLLLKDGINEWNYITEESIEYQFELIKKEKALAVLAEEDDIIGFAVLIHEDSYFSHIKKYGHLTSKAYIKDVVVDKNHTGKGIGSKLLNECMLIAKKHKCDTVYVERHQENIASAKMMEKVGFQVVETFYDPKKRFSGSKKTSILIKNL